MKNPYLRVQFSGYGHYKLFTTYYNQPIMMTTNDMQLIDDIKDGKKSAINAAVVMVRRFFKYTV